MATSWLTSIMTGQWSSKVPFLNTDANQISAGDTAQVQILETYETVSGTVTAVSSMEQTLSGGSVVRMVTIEVGNPGGISTSSTAGSHSQRLGVQRRRDVHRKAGRDGHRRSRRGNCVDGRGRGKLCP